MARATITPTCGLTTKAQATAEDMQRVRLDIESECAAIRKLAAELPEVNPFEEITKRGSGPRLLAAGQIYCSHTSCPVPAALIKAVEVAAGLDLPKPVIIEITDD